MIIAGAGGHAKEILDIVLQRKDIRNLVFFDNVNKHEPYELLGYKIISSSKDALRYLSTDRRFALGSGGAKARHQLQQLFLQLGGELTSIISETSIISKHNVVLGAGLNVMHFALISADVFIGEGTLINARASIHHDVKIGDYCEIGPASVLLGNVTLGSFTTIGSGAVILPGITIGDNVVIGAGAVVTKNVGSNTVLAGVPAKDIR